VFQPGIPRIPENPDNQMIADCPLVRRMVR
jgi:hypothetical protein